MVNPHCIVLVLLRLNTLLQYYQVPGGLKIGCGILLFCSRMPLVGLYRRLACPGATFFAARSFASTTTKRMFQESPSGILAANVYVSEGRDESLIQHLSNAAKEAAPRALSCHVFSDEKYHRTGFTLAGTASAVQSAVLALTTEALEKIDLRKHVQVTHPRTGVVDHIVFHPLADPQDLSLSARTAVELAQVVGAECKVPVYLYGAAHNNGRQLAELRRQLGYFRGAQNGKWSGALPENSSRSQLPEPDFGSFDAFEKGGAICVGATPWVVNYNIPVGQTDMKVAREIAKAVSERGGGLPKVQAMALPHSSGTIEIACNILDSAMTLTADVQNFVKSKVVDTGSWAIVAPGYNPGLDPEKILAAVREKLDSNDE